MSYTLTLQNLPQFMMNIGFLLSTQSSVECNIETIVDDEKLVAQRRKENPNRSNEIRSDLKKNPSKWSHLVTLATQ